MGCFNTNPGKIECNNCQKYHQCPQTSVFNANKSKIPLCQIFHTAFRVLPLSSQYKRNVYLILFVITGERIHDNVYSETKCHGPLRFTTWNNFIFPASKWIFCPGTAQIVLRINNDCSIPYRY